MPHIAFDLDAMKRVAPAARAAGISVEAMGWGLAQLWAWCWDRKRDTATAGHLAGHFGGDGTRVGAALVEFDFAEALDGEFRIRGAQKYLRISQARSEAGKQRNTATRFAGRFTSNSPAFAGGLTSKPPASHQQVSSKPPALTPNTEHRTPNTSKDVVATTPKEPAPTEVVAPTTPPEAWTAQDFWAYAQSNRIAGGYLPERPPHPRKLGDWWSGSQMTPGVTARALKGGWSNYGQDPYWEKPGYPFNGFMSQWAKYTRPEVSDGAAA
jgi:hypothetical protein